MKIYQSFVVAVDKLRDKAEGRVKKRKSPNITISKPIPKAVELPSPASNVPKRRAPPSAPLPPLPGIDKPLPKPREYNTYNPYARPVLVSERRRRLSVYGSRWIQSSGRLVNPGADLRDLIPKTPEEEIRTIGIDKRPNNSDDLTSLSQRRPLTNDTIGAGLPSPNVSP